MLSEAGLRTAERCRGRDVLVIQDTTVVRSEGGGGDYLHAVLALDAEDDTILGLVDGQFLQRASGRKALRRALPIEEKESFRWLEGADQAASVCAGARQVTIVADREGDIYEAFALRPEGADLLVRAAQDRSLEDGGQLFTALDALPEAGQADLDLPAQPGRRRRTARLAVRFATMTLARPNRSFRAGLPDAVEMQLVDVREVSPPAGEPAVHWRLLTTRPVGDAAEAWAIVDLYGPSSNCSPPSRPRGSTSKACGSKTPSRGTSSSPQRSSLRSQSSNSSMPAKNPHPKSSLAYAAWVCARLGGWTGYYGKPGPVVMLQGWLEIQSAKRTISTLGYNLNV
jgi:hypothetical protein